MITRDACEHTHKAVRRVRFQPILCTYARVQTVQNFLLGFHDIRIFAIDPHVRVW